jgi:S-adenosylmethionine:tRNA ribosyltransferase-isomerase
MIAASIPVQRPPDARLLVISDGQTRHIARSTFPDLLRAGDVVVANDAATVPASLLGVHVPTGSPVEARLAGQKSLCPDATRFFSAVIFGSGNYLTPTEYRPKPPKLRSGDKLRFGSLGATIVCLLDHPRFVLLEFHGSSEEIWEGLARHGRPIQYAHVPTPLAIWDTWTPIAGPLAAFEPPSASFILNWATIDSLIRRGVLFCTITHAAGISSTGDPSLDARLPFDEPYRIPKASATAIQDAHVRGGRVIAIGTTVVRALEHAAGAGGELRPGEGLATQKIGSGTKLRIVDAIVSGTHERGTSHFELLRAFLDDGTLDHMARELAEHQYRTHEFGDSVFVEKKAAWADRPAADPAANALQ